MYAVQIKMRDGAKFSNNPKDIETIYVCENKNIQAFLVEDLYVYLKEMSNDKIFLKDKNHYLVPTIAANGKRYIRSTPNEGMVDGLMKLPRR